ncbi:MAG: hypothetical protein ABIO55_03520 [Ginsengibacter sp.]
MDEVNNIEAVVQRAKTQLAAFYNGNPWVTDNFATKVLSLIPDEALKKIQGHSHSVTELVGHMIAWRNLLHKN